MDNELDPKWFFMFTPINCFQVRNRFIVRFAESLSVERGIYWNTVAASTRLKSLSNVTYAGRDSDGKR